MDKRWPKVVERGLRELSQENPDNFQLERSMARVHQQVEAHRRTRHMRKVANTLIPIGVVAVIFAALLLIPATYSVTVGSVIEIKVPNADHELISSMMGVAKDNPEIERSQMMVTPEGLVMNFASSETDRSKVENTVREMIAPKLGDREYQIKSEPVKVERGGNALAALTGGTIRINTDGLSDSAIEDAISQAILGMGAIPTNVNVTTSPDGTERDIHIEMEADVPPGEEIEFNFEFDGDEPQGDRVIQREIVTEDE